MIGHFLVAFVQDGFIAVVLDCRRFGVVRNQKSRNTAIIIVRMHVAEQPVLGLHVTAGFRIGFPTAGKYRNEDVRRLFLTCDRICDVQRITSPVNLHRVTGFVSNPHRGFRDTGPAAIFLAELGIHVRYASGVANLDAILTPKQGKRYARSCQLTMDPFVIRHSVWGCHSILPREQDFLDILVSDIVA